MKKLLSLYERFDMDKDGDIDIVDIMKVVVHWGETCE
jgi:Ca2+-binding EF-hand superfamily protein